MTVTAELMERGRQRFNINCAVCHGMTAPVMESQSNTALPRSLRCRTSGFARWPTAKFSTRSRNGKNTMLAYGPNVIVTDRWAIIAYLRALQRSQNATEADVPPEHRADLDKPAEPKAEPKPEAPKK